MIWNMIISLLLVETKAVAWGRVSIYKTNMTNIVAIFELNISLDTVGPIDREHL